MGGRPRGEYWEEVITDKQNKQMWTCKHCQNTYSGGHSRIKAHLEKTPGQGIVVCSVYQPSQGAQHINTSNLIHPHEAINTLNPVQDSQRADAVASMVYEAGARIRDPVYGSAGAICQLQEQVNELQAQLAKVQAELVNMQFQQANLVALICMEMTQTPQESPQQSMDNFIPRPPHSNNSYHINLNFFEENTNLNVLCEPLSLQQIWPTLFFK